MFRAAAIARRCVASRARVVPRATARATRRRIVDVLTRASMRSRVDAWRHTDANDPTRGFFSLFLARWH